MLPQAKHQHCGHSNSGFATGGRPRWQLPAATPVLSVPKRGCPCVRFNPCQVLHWKHFPIYVFTKKLARPPSQKINYLFPKRNYELLLWIIKVGKKAIPVQCPTPPLSNLFSNEKASMLSDGKDGKVPNCYLPSGAQQIQIDNNKSRLIHNITSCTAIF